MPYLPFVDRNVDASEAPRDHAWEGVIRDDGNYRERSQLSLPVLTRLCIRFARISV